MAKPNTTPWFSGESKSASDYQDKCLRQATKNNYVGQAYDGNKVGVEKAQPSGLADAASIRSWSARATFHSRQDQRGRAGDPPTSGGRQPGGDPPGRR